MFGILGVTHVWTSYGSPVAVGGPRRRALLALLLLDAGRIVTVERLVDGLYGEHPPAGVANALQSQVSRLRQVLPRPVEFHPAGYRLAAEPEDVDAYRFQRLADDGRAALAAGAPDRAAAQLRGALALWRGPALADVGDAPFAPPQVARLEELRVMAVEDRVEADLALGGHRDVVADLRQLVAAHPLRERLRGQLMRALYGSGRQAEALEAYEDARRELAETLGADPGPELAAVHLAVLRSAPGLMPAPAPVRVPLPATAPASTPEPFALPSTAAVVPIPAQSHGRPLGDPDGSDVPRGTSGTEVKAAPASDAPAFHSALPAQLTSFVGRGEELERIASQLDQGRLVTLIGPGGAGKTRIAVEAARRYGWGGTQTCFVELAGVADPAEVPQAVLSALGLRESGGLLATGGPAPDPVGRLAAALEDRALLLVLDNCEHVVAETARLVALLLAGCSELRVLSTTREPLGITGETLCPVGALLLPPAGTGHRRAREFPAVRLFAERARAVQPHFDLEADLDAVLRLCTALDGLPLAIELAAARLRSLSAAEIAVRLGAVSAADSADPTGMRPDERFRLLSRGSRTAQPRQQTLRGVVDWSWDLLSETERTVLRRASVFAGGWTLDAAEAVCADGQAIEAYDVLDLVDSLVDKSLVMTWRPAGGAGIRYRLLETIRAYSVDRLEEAGETEWARRSHAAYFLGLAGAADPHLRRAEQLVWLRRLSAEHENLHAALRRAADAGDITTGLRLTAELSTYWMLRGMRQEGGQPARQLLRTIGPVPPPGLESEYALGVVAAASVTPDRAELTACLAATEKIVAGQYTSPGRYPILFLLWAPFLGIPDRERYERTQAEIPVERADPWYVALSHVGEGFQEWMANGDPEEAERRFTQALAGFRALGDRLGTALVLNQLAWLADYRGDVPRAVAIIDEALALAADLDAVESVAELLCQRADCLVRVGDHEAAHADFDGAVELARRAGVPDIQARAHLGLGESARLRGRLVEARRLCEVALTECRAGWFAGEGTRASVQVALGRVCAAEGDVTGFRAHLREAFGAVRGAVNLPFAAVVAEGWAGVAVLDGEPARAAELLGMACALRGAGLPVGRDAARDARTARAALGTAGYEEAHESGASLAHDEVLRRLTALTTAG